MVLGEQVNSKVNRFVNRLDQSQPILFRRVKASAREGARVDSGTAAPILRQGGKHRRPYVFRIVLS
jgi:hypothetical protein